MSTANIRQKTDQNIRKKTARNSIKKEYHAEINDLLCDALDSLDMQSTAGIIGVANPTTAPSGMELNGASYRVSNSKQTPNPDDGSNDDVYLNFLDSAGNPVIVPASTSGLITKSNNSWSFVKDNLNTSNLLETVSINMIDVSKIDFAHRYSKLSKSIIAADSLIAASGRMKIKGGQLYTVSQNGIYNITVLPQGGYFVDDTTNSAAANIDFIKIPDGSGFYFQAPEEYDGYYVILNLNTTIDHDFDGYIAMMNIGSAALPYQDYNPQQQIRDSLLPKTETPLNARDVIDISRNKTVNSINYSSIWKRYSPFILNFLEKNKDLDIVLLGDSIFAKTINYTQYPVSVQQSRPPTLISKSIASGIWDKINDGSTLCARWDKPGIFTESGSAWTSYFGFALKAPWDDANDRTAETREFIGTGAASTAFKFNAGNKRLNFVYRTSTEGCSTLTVAISGGNGKELVFDRPSRTWVEANGYTFSQSYLATGTGYGNTEYGRRLKFKKVAAEVGNEHTITITKPASALAESLMYWGTEQSNRDYIVTIRNVARGGHDMNMLWQYIRTEFDNYDTDLVLFEIPIINMLNNQPQIGPGGFWSDTTYGIQPKLLGDDANSLKSLSSGFTAFQVIPTLLLDSNISRVNADGTLKEFQYGGVTYTLDSYFNYLAGKFWESSDQTGFLNVWHWYKLNCVATFGDLYTALSESGVNSQGSYVTVGHPNDYGAENILQYLRPLFDFALN